MNTQKTRKRFYFIYNEALNEEEIYLQAYEDLLEELSEDLREMERKLFIPVFIIKSICSIALLSCFYGILNNETHEIHYGTIILIISLSFLIIKKF